MPSQEDMDLCTDKVLSKGRILQELTKAVKLVSGRLLETQERRIKAIRHILYTHV